MCPWLSGYGPDFLKICRGRRGWTGQWLIYNNQSSASMLLHPKMGLICGSPKAKLNLVLFPTHVLNSISPKRIELKYLSITWVS